MGLDQIWCWGFTRTTYLDFTVGSIFSTMSSIKRSYDAGFKMRAILQYDRIKNYSKIAGDIGVDHKTVMEWVRNRENISRAASGANPGTRKLHQGPIVRCPSPEALLYTWFENERNNGRAVSNKALQTRMRQYSGGQIKASSRWLQGMMMLLTHNTGWKKRHSVSLRRSTNDSQHPPMHYEETVRAFRQNVRDVCMNKSIPYSNVWNMDQTMVRFDSPQSRTNNRIGDSHIRIMSTGGKKRGFTVALCASAMGTKLPAFIIFKEPSGRIPPRVAQTLAVPANVIIGGCKNGWMTAEQLRRWFALAWMPNVVGRNILLLDQYRPHHTADLRTMLAGH
jgi:hypothetical protein